METGDRPDPETGAVCRRLREQTTTDAARNRPNTTRTDAIPTVYWLDVSYNKSAAFV